MNSSKSRPKQKKSTELPAANPAPSVDTKVGVRQRLLNAALELIQTEGFFSLTQKRVSKLAGVRQSHLTYYFPTHSDLLKAVSEESKNILLEALGNQGKPTLKNFRDVLTEAAFQKHSPRLILTIVMAAEVDLSVKNWQHSFNKEFLSMLKDAFLQAKLQVTERDLRLYQAAVVGALVTGLSDTDSESMTTTVTTVQMAFDELVSKSRVITSDV